MIKKKMITFWGLFRYGLALNFVLGKLRKIGIVFVSYYWTQEGVDDYKPPFSGNVDEYEFAFWGPEEMKAIAQGATDFFAKYEHGDSSLQFGRDLGELFGILRARIQKEESLLYPEYEATQDNESTSR